MNDGQNPAPADEVSQQVTPEQQPIPPAPADQSESVTTSSSSDNKPLITWTASEFIAHDKTLLWYITSGLVGLVISVAALLILHDVITALVLVICTIVFIVYGARKPQEVAYQLDDSGITIGRKHYMYHEFRSFSIIDEGVFASLAFVPHRRFSPLLSAYFDPADEEAITEVLSNYLPISERHLDVVERALKRIRF